MKNFSLFFLLAFIFFQGCKKDSSTVTEPTPNPQSLVANPTFHLNGVPSFNGWTITDTFLVRLSNDIPQGGSGTSVVFGLWTGPYAGWPVNSLYTCASGIEGVHTYKLSFWAKFENDSGGGGMFVYLNRPGSIDSREFLSVTLSDTSWKYYSLIDTINTSANDTLFITLFGGSGENVGTVYMNTCNFELMN